MTTDAGSFFPSQLQSSSWTAGFDDLGYLLFSLNKHVFSFEKSRRYDNNQQTTVTHFGENKRLHLESSKQNYYIISFMSNNKSNLHSLVSPREKMLKKKRDAESERRSLKMITNGFKGAHMRGIQGGGRGRAQKLFTNTNVRYI